MDLERAQRNLEFWLKADEMLAQGKTMTINGRSITLPSADEIATRITYWERKVAELKSSKTSTKKQSGVALANFNNDYK